MREEILENIKYNLETGFITQEEYDKMVLEMEEYAVVVSD